MEDMMGRVFDMYFDQKDESTRSEKIAKFAEASGMPFQRHLDREVQLAYQAFPLFSSGSVAHIYVLRGKDEQAIRACFKPTALRFFEGKPGPTIEAVGDTLIYYYPSILLAMKDIQPTLEEAKQVWQVLAG